MSTTDLQSSGSVRSTASLSQKRGSRIPTRTKYSKERPPASEPPHSQKGPPPVQEHKPLSCTGLTRKVSKENIVPENNSEPAAPSTVKTLNHKSNMGYMELKRHHRDLATELQSMEGKSKEMESSHQAEVERLVFEVQECKESNAVMRKQIESYQEVIKEKNLSLKSLQEKLNEIKFENERVTAMLEWSRIDAVTGNKIGKTEELVSTQKATKAEMEKQTQAVDDFISQLESTVLQLEEHTQDHRVDPMLTDLVFPI